MPARLTENYVAIPLRLAADLRDSPIAIGIYALIARLYLIVQAPVALSRSDIQRYDPALKQGAVKRALDRLTSTGWLVEEAGHKCRYVPTWGYSRAGVARPWQIGPRLGCPTHIFTTRLDKTLLDTFMGKLTPHSRLPASIERYLSAPLLGLRDIGAYVLAATGQPLAPSAALYQWGLVRDGQPQPIPATEQVLALASQRQQEDAGAVQLLPAGWLRLGMPATGPGQSSQPSPRALPLFFAPKALIGDLIPRLIDDSIGCSSSHEAPDIALERANTSLATSPPIMQGNPGKPMETNDPPQQPGGGSDSFKEKKTGEAAGIADTPSARLLWAINAHPKSIAELAHLPIELVEQATAYAKATPGIMNIPGWVVDALRRHRDEHWPLPQLRGKRCGEPIDVQEVMSGAYGDLFRRGGDLAGLDSGVPGSEQVWPGAGTSDALADPIPSPWHPGGQWLSTSTPQPDQSWSAEQLAQRVCEDLALRCERPYQKLIRRLQVQIRDDRTVVQCASPADRITVMSALMGVLRCVVADLGLPADICVTDGAAPGTGGVPGRSASSRWREKRTAEPVNR